MDSRAWPGVVQQRGICRHRMNAETQPTAKRRRPGCSCQHSRRRFSTGQCRAGSDRERPCSGGNRIVPKAKRNQHLSRGRFSQIDSFDYKPDLAEITAMPSIKNIDLLFGKSVVSGNDWAFRQHGQSDYGFQLFPHLASVADELTVIRSCTRTLATAGLFLHNSGFPVNGSVLAVDGTVARLPSRCRRLLCCRLPRRTKRRGVELTSGLPATHQGVAFEGGAQGWDLFRRGSQVMVVTAGAEFLA